MAGQDIPALRLSLAKFIKDPRTIRAFEQLGDATLDSTSIAEEALAQAEGAETLASLALALIDALSEASYVTLSPNSTLDAERVLTAGNLISLNDAGPGGNVTVNVARLSLSGSSSLAFTLSGNTTLTLPTTGTVLTGGTTVGLNLLNLADPAAIRFLRVNADNSVSALTDVAFRTAIGAGTGTGSVTSVAFSGGTTGLSASGGPITGSGTFTLSGVLVVANGGTGVATLTAGALVKGNGTSPVTASIITDTGTRAGVNRASPASTFDVNGSTSVADGGYCYTPYNGGTDTGTVRAGVQFDGASQTLNFYSAASYRGGVDASGNYRPGSDNAVSCGTAGNRWSVVYAGAGAINTSDRRSKKNIGPIPSKWLDAWGDVEWCRFKFRPGKRWHVGLIAQQVHEAFARHGLDAFEIGLCCYDEWDDEHITVIGKRGKPLDKPRRVRKAGNRWGLRYDECQAIEAAWQRREIARQDQRITALERKLSV